MRGYRTVAGREILKVLHDNKIILEEKKKMRRHYYLTGSPVRDGALGARSPQQGRALDGDRLSTRWETQEDERRCDRVKFLLPQEISPSRSLVRMDTTHDRGGIKQPSSIPTFTHL